MEFYQKALRYLAENDLRSTSRFRQEYVMGDVSTVFWAMILGKPAEWALQDDCQTFHCQAQEGVR